MGRALTFSISCRHQMSAAALALTLALPVSSMRAVDPEVDALSKLPLPPVAVELSAFAERSLLPTIAPEGPPSGATSQVLKEVEDLSHGLSDSCDSWYGQKMLTSNRKNVVEVCAPTSPTGSNVYCLERTPFDIPRYLCVFENAELTGHEDPKTKHDFELGVSNCARKFDVLHPAKAWGWWEKPTMEHIATKPRLECKHVVEHPVLLYKFWQGPSLPNMYEAFADFINLFESALVLEWDFQDVEVMAPNLEYYNPKVYPLFEAVRRLYGGRGLRYGSQWFKNNTCFSKIALPPSPGLCTLSANHGRAGQTACRAPVIMASASMIRSVFPEVRALPKRQGCLLSLMHRGKGARTIDSQGMVRQLSYLLDQQGPKNFTASVYDPVGQPLWKGLSVMSSTALLWGLHGAGMMHTLFLPSGAALLELFCGDRGPGNGHYKTIAAMIGVHYNHMAASQCADYTKEQVATQALKEIPIGSSLACML